MLNLSNLRTVRCWSSTKLFHTSPKNYTDQLKVFRDNASKWWTGEEFSILRSMNEIRVPFIVNGIGSSMTNSKILDVGCGGGILSEPLARLGANVLGIDPVFESINQAQNHSQLDPKLENKLKYRNCNIEDLSTQSEHIAAYDGLVASEVLEHISDVEGFLQHCTKLIKPNGSLFITTINQTPLAWLGVIFFGEQILRQIPKGTHSYDMFVNVKGLKIMLERIGYHVKLINGFMYEPVSGNFYWTPTTLTHYALHAVKRSPPAKGIYYEQRRYKTSKQKRSKPKIILDREDMMSVIPFDQYEQKVQAIMTEFKEHLNDRLTMRANTAALENLKIQLDGLSEPLELKDIAQLNMKGSNLIVINLTSMPEAVKPTLSALMALGNLSPQIEVNNIFVPIPRVTREHREKLVGVAKQVAANTKDKLRSLFTEFSSKAKAQKSRGGVSDDLIHDVIENLQSDIHKYTSEIEALLKSKTNQLLNEA